VFQLHGNGVCGNWKQNSKIHIQQSVLDQGIAHCVFHRHSLQLVITGLLYSRHFLSSGTDGRVFERAAKKARELGEARADLHRLLFPLIFRLSFYINLSAGFVRMSSAFAYNTRFPLSLPCIQKCPSRTILGSTLRVQGFSLLSSCREFLGWYVIIGLDRFVVKSSS
jgi:hypothetical protein